jgi:hypothetical protein
VSVCPRARRPHLSYGERKRSIDLPRGPDYVLHSTLGVDDDVQSVTNVLARVRRGVGVLASFVAVACAAPAMAQEPVPAPDPAPAEAAPAATPAPSATPDPAPSSTRRRQPAASRPTAAARPRSAPVAPGPAARRATSAPAAPARRSTATTAHRAHAKRSHRRREAASHHRSRAAADSVAGALHRVAAPVFPTVVPAPALSARATRRSSERPLALAGGALLALVVASCGLLVLTARAERERIGT